MHFPRTSPVHTNVLDEKEIKRLLKCLENEPVMWKVIIHLALSTGCRRGEIAALQWDDIIWEKHQITVCKSLKTNTSNRTITVPSYIIEMLKQYRSKQLEVKLSSGQEWNKHNMIFTDKKGDYISPHSISNWFKYFLQKNTLPHIKFHALRQQKVKPKTKNLFSFLYEIFYFPFNLYTIFFKNIDFINKEVY